MGTWVYMGIVYMFRLSAIPKVRVRVRFRVLVSGPSEYACMQLMVIVMM